MRESIWAGREGTIPVGSSGRSGRRCVYLPLRCLHGVADIPPFIRTRVSVRIGILLMAGDELSASGVIQTFRKPTPALRARPIHRLENIMKYLLAWLLGVPGSILILVFIFSRVL